MTRRRVAVLLAAVVCLLAGCSSAIDGQGHIGSASSGPDFSSGSKGPSTPNPSTGGPTSGAPTSSGPPVPFEYRRTPVSTAIGDPPTANLCAVLDLPAFRALKLAPSLSDYQTPPGCTVRLLKGADVFASVSVFGSKSDTHQPTGTTTATSHGLRVFSHPFTSTGRYCQRTIVARGLNLDVYSFARAQASGPAVEEPVCKAADLMLDQVAAAVSKGSVPRLRLARPSVSDLDFCRVVRDTDLDGAPIFKGTKPTADGVSDGCLLSGTGITTYLDFSVLGFGQAKNGKTLTIDGHDLEIGDSNTDTYCFYTSTQQPLADGFAEAVTVSSSITGSGGKDLCQQTERLVAAFLTKADLK